MSVLCLLLVVVCVVFYAFERIGKVGKLTPAASAAANSAPRVYEIIYLHAEWCSSSSVSLPKVLAHKNGGQVWFLRAHTKNHTHSAHTEHTIHKLIVVWNRDNREEPGAPFLNNSSAPNSNSARLHAPSNDVEMIASSSSSSPWLAVVMLAVPPTKHQQPVKVKWFSFAATAVYFFKQHTHKKPPPHLIAIAIASPITPQ